MIERRAWSFVPAPASLGLAAALALVAVVANGQTGPDLQPAVMVGEDLIRVFQEGKDAAEQADPPEVSLGPAFDPQPDYR
jgi:hypothetical protein